MLPTSPPEAVAANEFIGFGYTAGDDTGLTTDGYVFKRYYADGCARNAGTCPHGGGDGDTGYYLYIFGPVSQSQNHTFQVQRKTCGTGCAQYFYWFDGALQQYGGGGFVTLQSMTWAEVDMGSESSTFPEDACGRYNTLCHTRLNATEQSYLNIYTHQWGAASAAPPGSSNMNLEGYFLAGADNDPCPVAFFEPQSRVDVQGAC
jgi:hypothetical protein